MTTKRTVALVALSVYVLFLLDLALLQFPSKNPRPNFIPLHSMIADWTAGGRGFVVNFVGNLVAFMPIGLMPSLCGPVAREPGMWCCSACASAHSSRWDSMPPGVASLMWMTSYSIRSEDSRDISLSGSLVIGHGSVPGIVLSPGSAGLWLSAFASSQPLCVRADDPWSTGRGSASPAQDRGQRLMTTLAAGGFGG